MGKFMRNICRPLKNNHVLLNYQNQILLSGLDPPFHDFKGVETLNTVEYY